MKELVIVGGGVAGLSAGIYAQLRGFHATVVEKHRVPGGNLTGWNRDGRHIDNCIHWLTGTNPVTENYEMWKTLGALGEVGVHRLPTLYTYRKHGKSLSLHRDLERLRKDMLALSPEDAEKTEQLIADIRAAIHFTGIGGEKNDRKSTQLERLAALPVLKRYYGMTTGELAAQFHDPTIRGFLRSLLTERFGAVALLLVFATFCSGDGDLPEDGSLAMAWRMADRFQSLGGSLRLGVGAKRVCLEHSLATAVELADGTVLPADYVILSCDPEIAFGKLLDRSLMPDYLRKQYEDLRLRRFSACQCAFACQMKKLPFVGEQVFELPPALRKKYGASYLLVREFSHETGYSGREGSLLQTMFFIDEDACIRLLHAAVDRAAYQSMKTELSADMERALAAEFPALDGQLRCLDAWTPVSYRRYTGAAVGSFMGFAFGARVLPVLRSGRVPGVKNLLLASQWQQPPGGLPIAAKAGRAAIELIAKNKK